MLLCDAISYCAPLLTSTTMAGSVSIISQPSMASSLGLNTASLLESACFCQLVLRDPVLWDALAHRLEDACPYGLGMLTSERSTPLAQVAHCNKGDEKSYSKSGKCETPLTCTRDDFPAHDLHHDSRIRVMIDSLYHSTSW